MLSNDRIHGPTRSGKATSYALIFPKLSSQNMHGALNMLSVTSRLLSPVSTVSARNAWDHNLLLASIREKKETLAV